MFRTLKSKLLLGAGVLVGLPVAGLATWMVLTGNTYSEGFRMGELTDFGPSGYWFLANDSAEGELLMGHQSSKLTEDGKQVNPWEFSAPSAMYDRYRQHQGQGVAIKYRQKIVYNPWVYATDYEVQEITPVAEAKPPVACASNSIGGSRRTVDTPGRFVKITRRGNAIKTTEITFQIGSSGNQFEDMSITDPDIAACAEQWLLSGKRVLITYDRDYFRINPFGQDTVYDIVKIEPVKSGQE